MTQDTSSNPRLEKKQAIDRQEKLLRQNNQDCTSWKPEVRVTPRVFPAKLYRILFVNKREYSPITVLKSENLRESFEMNRLKQDWKLVKRKKQKEKSKD